jgi:hypothetical protein
MSDISLLSGIRIGSVGRFAVVDVIPVQKQIQEGEVIYRPIQPKVLITSFRPKVSLLPQIKKK